MHAITLTDFSQLSWCSQTHISWTMVNTQGRAEIATWRTDLANWLHGTPMQSYGCIYLHIQLCVLLCENVLNACNHIMLVSCAAVNICCIMHTAMQLTQLADCSITVCWCILKIWMFAGFAWYLFSTMLGYNNSLNCAIIIIVQQSYSFSCIIIQIAVHINVRSSHII